MTKTSPLRDIIFIALTILLLLIIIFAALHPFSAPPSPSHSGVAASMTTAPHIPDPTASPTLPALATTLDVSGTQWGRSTCYIGAVEGSSNFNIADLQDLGINAYHIYGGMARWEAKDDSKVYGAPTIAQIQANPNVINWDIWDKAMTDPPGGSDYSWVNASPAWHGNARTLFSELQAAGVRVLLDLRNRDDQNQPSWAPDPPTTTADWNEWWEHVFALVYWLNVRNHYNINDFEVLNEPDLYSQGWHGTLEQYEQFVQYTSNAIGYVYKTYLPDHTYHLYGPDSLGRSTWPDSLMKQGIIDSVDIHNYAINIARYVEQVHGWMKADGYANAPLWLGEWGTYTENAYDLPAIGIRVLNNLIRGSSPGDDYIYGSTIFTLYDYATKRLGLINAKDEQRLDYYAFRLGIRALQGCRPTYQSVVSNKDLLALTTRNKDSSYSLLITNQSQRQSYTIDAKLSAFISSGYGTLQRFDAQNRDTTAGSVQIANGHTTLTLPPDGALLLTFTS